MFQEPAPERRGGAFRSWLLKEGGGLIGLLAYWLNGLSFYTFDRGHTVRVPWPSLPHRHYNTGFNNLRSATTPRASVYYDAAQAEACTSVITTLIVRVSLEPQGAMI